MINGFYQTECFSPQQVRHTMSPESILFNSSGKILDILLS